MCTSDQRLKLFRLLPDKTCCRRALALVPLACSHLQPRRSATCTNRLLCLALPLCFRRVGQRAASQVNAYAKRLAPRGSALCSSSQNADFRFQERSRRRLCATQRTCSTRLPACFARCVHLFFPAISSFYRLAASSLSTVNTLPLNIAALRSATSTASRRRVDEVSRGGGQGAVRPCLPVPPSSAYLDIRPSSYLLCCHARLPQALRSLP